MILTDLLNDLEQRGIRLWPDNGQLGIRAPKGTLTPALREQILAHKTEILKLLSRADGAEIGALPQIVPAPEQKHQPFPLTDIQQAYWVGRTADYELGNVSIHMYWELERAGLDIDRLERAWNCVVDRHDMLRAVMLPDGQMRILERVPPYRIHIHDFRGKEPEAAAEQLEALRANLSHQVLPLDEWPAFELQAALLEEDRVRVYISIDLVHIDASSLTVLFRDLIQFYRDPGIALPPLEVSFRDYVLAERLLRETEAYRRSLDYWRNRVAVLPPAPELPLAGNPGSLKNPRFTHRKSRLDAASWLRLKTYANERGLTPSAILLTAYSEVLAAWSRVPEFTINVTLFNRLPMHPQVNDILGDFTSMILLEVENAPGEAFEARVRRIQKRLWTDLEYNQSSGVESLRELARVRQKVSGAIMPVVFTSLLSPGRQGFQPPLTDLNELGEVVYEISQTPQVWLDHQVFEESGLLVFNWDAVDELFPAGMLDHMFDSYCGLLRSLADGQSWQETRLQLVPATQLEQRAVLNATGAPVPEGLLHTLFEQQVVQRPNQPAVIASDRTLTYAQLDRMSNQVGHRLRALGIQPNSLVAVVMEKGWEQIVAVLGILKAGGAYIPIDAGFPKERTRFFIENGEVTVALTQPWISGRLELPDGVLKISISDQELAGSSDMPLAAVQTPQDLAYVLYTSGSTGRPKGAMIEHRSVINRMADVAKRFGLSSDDRAIGLTALHHDLSVFDIFGMLVFVGGSIVLPEAAAVRDPGHWVQLMSQERITVWNSVPSFMQMFVEYVESNPGRLKAPVSLRWVILSGDYIPVDLPDRLRALVNNVEIVGAGGPTETTVWDICYPVGEVDSAWKSIPYGCPMANAQYHILKETLEPCPVWVTGELYIAGAGLGRGYWRDQERTATSFITHPETGQRLYRSGDLGRYLPDGNIEIIGRKDLQVKIRGYRIELGEIEAALAGHPAVQAVAAATIGDGPGSKRLVAYIVPSQAQVSVSADNEPKSLANAQWLRSFSDGDHQFEGILRDPIERLEFLLKQRHPNGTEPDRPEVQLAKPELNEALLKEYGQRRSQRSFASEPLPFSKFCEFMSCLGEIPLDGALLPKYRYPSAGGLYPVRTFVYIVPGRVEGLSGGAYLYDPRSHRLKLLSADARIDRSVHAPINQAIFDACAFSLFLIGDLKSISPMYGELAKDFCMLEAGYMGQLLMTAAPATGIGICPIGGLEFQGIRDSFQLDESQIYLHSVMAGPINPVPSVAAASPQSPTETGLVTELRRYLMEKLPEYMVPSAFVVLDALPLTPNGKLDRAALPSPDAVQRVKARTAPESEMERTLSQILQEIIPIETVGIHENFFDMGANSVHMVRFGSKLREVLRRDVSVVNMFKYPTVASLAQFLSQEELGPSSLSGVQQQANRRIDAVRKRRQLIEKQKDG